MNFEEKAKIRKNYVLFKEHILFGGKSSALLDHLCASDVITTDDYERILSEGISPEKVQRLLRVLETKKKPQDVSTSSVMLWIRVAMIF